MAQVNHEAEFQQLLMHPGLSPSVIQLINDNGFNNTLHLIGVDEKDISNVLKIIRNSTVPPTQVPYIAQNCLNTLCYWVNRHYQLQELIAASDFTPAALEAFMTLLQLDNQEEDNSQVKPPSQFKANTKWKQFKEGAIVYFNSLHTKSQIPLAYVIRENEVPDPTDVYESEHQRLIAVTPLHGIKYSEDKGMSFDYLKLWTLTGLAWAWMRNCNSTRNSCDAWLALVGHYEGDAQKDCIRDQAYTNILAMKYYGEKKKFTFKTYIMTHQEAFEDLEQYGERVSEEIRVRDLLTGIKDPTANAAKQAILATPHLQNNFKKTVSYLATFLQLRLIKSSGS